VSGLLPHPWPGLYAARIPARTPTELHRLVSEAALADEAMARAHDADDFTFRRAEKAQQSTRQALLDHLLNEHGITGSMAASFGSVIA
jgi:hypothetical protein